MVSPVCLDKQAIKFLKYEFKWGWGWVSFHIVLQAKTFNSLGWLHLFRLFLINVHSTQCSYKFSASSGKGLLVCKIKTPCFLTSHYWYGKSRVAQWKTSEELDRVSVVPGSYSCDLSKGTSRTWPTGSSSLNMTDANSWSAGLWDSNEIVNGKKVLNGSFALGLQH